MTTNFEKLLQLNVNDKTEKRLGDNKVELTYLSWSWAWAEFKKVYPDAQYNIIKYQKADGTLVPYMFDEHLGYMVSTQVTADGLTYEMWLPAMNSSNKSLKQSAYDYTTKFGTKTVAPCTMFDINKTIMRCLVKNLAMFGLGLYLYAGDDLPEGEKEEKPKSNNPPAKPKSATTMPKSETVKLIGQEEKDTLKTVLGLPRYAQEMNKCGGKMPVEVYQQLLVESEG